MIKKLILNLIFATTIFANENLISNETELEIEKKINEYVERALKDDSEAYLELGKIYYEGKDVPKDYLKAAKFFNASYHLGNVNGAYHLGLFYANDKNSMFDSKKALSLFLELARKGHAASQNKVGMFFASGTVVETDYKEAVKWFEDSSKQGFIDAQCNLAYMYATGQGVWQNMGRAHAFAKPGYEKGNISCKKVWEEFSLEKYPEDKGFKFKFYNEP